MPSPRVLGYSHVYCVILGHVQSRGYVRLAYTFLEGGAETCGKVAIGSAISSFTARKLKISTANLPMNLAKIRKFVAVDREVSACFGLTPLVENSEKV